MIPSFNGVSIELLKLFGYIIREDYISIINQVLFQCHFLQNIIKRFITFLHKGNIQILLKNWRPIAINP